MMRLEKVDTRQWKKAVFSVTMKEIRHSVYTYDCMVCSNVARDQIEGNKNSLQNTLLSCWFI